MLSIILAPIILMVYCIIDILKSQFKEGSMKLIWMLLVLFAPFIGSLIYLGLGQKQKI
jgi:hypothetical protein